MVITAKQGLTIKVESLFLFFVIYWVVIKLWEIQELAESHVERYCNLVKCMHLRVLACSP